jgi:hypothetical protein
VLRGGPGRRECRQIPAHVSIAYLAANGRGQPYVNAIQGNRFHRARVCVDRADLVEIHRDLYGAKLSHTV